MQTQRNVALLRGRWREPSPLLFGATHLTMNPHFDMDEIFRLLTGHTTKRDTPQNGTVFSPTHPITLYLQTLKSPPIYLQMASNQEQSIQQALNSLNIGSSSSIRKAAIKFGVSKSTLAY